jgi:hypothetical protein
VFVRVQERARTNYNDALSKVIYARIIITCAYAQDAYLGALNEERSQLLAQTALPVATVSVIASGGAGSAGTTPVLGVDDERRLNECVYYVTRYGTSECEA